MEKYYLDQIQTKIGYPSKSENLLRVHYNNNEASYDDVRYAGLGLIQHFIHADPDF